MTPNHINKSFLYFYFWPLAFSILSHFLILNSRTLVRFLTGGIRVWEFESRKATNHLVAKWKKVWVQSLVNPCGMSSSLLSPALSCHSKFPEVSTGLILIIFLTTFLYNLSQICLKLLNISAWYNVQ